MRKFIIAEKTVCLLILMLLMSSLFAGEQALIASGHPFYPPVMWREGDKITGAAAEIAETVLKDLKTPCVVKYAGSWDQVQKEAMEGKVDLIVAIYKNDERMKYLDFSIPYIEDPVVIFVKKGKTFSFKVWEDLVGKKGVTGTGESYGESFDEFMNKKLSMERISNRDGFKKLLDGSADYMIAGKYPGSIQAKQEGILHELEILITPVTTQQFYMAISKKSKYTGLLPEINKKLKHYTLNGFTERVIFKHQLKHEGNNSF